jgi:hypothetical protein
MSTHYIDRGFLPLLGFAILLMASSLDVINKLFGLPGVAVYAMFGFLIVVAGSKFALPALVSMVSEKWANILALATFAGMAALVVHAYPVVNAGTYGGGSDADDALILGANELIHGRYPFYASTYLGNPIAPMPGAVLLAVPFVLINLLPMQNVFWLAVFFGVVRNHLQSSVYALALLWLVLLCSPSVLQNLVTATDRVSNAVYVLAAMWLMIKTISGPDTATWKKILAAIFLGVCLSSRSNFVFLMPLLFSVLAQNSDWRTAIKYLAITGVACAAVTIPFWLYDPKAFTPFNVQSEKIPQLGEILPHANIIVPLSGMLLAIALSFRKMQLDCVVFLWNCAIVQLLFVILFTALASLSLGRLELYNVNYGVFFFFFVAFAAWITLKPERVTLPG